MRSFYAIGTLKSEWDKMSRLAFLSNCRCSNCSKHHFVKAGMLSEWETVTGKFIVFKAQSDGVNVFSALLAEMFVFFQEYLRSARGTLCPGDGSDERVA